MAPRRGTPWALIGGLTAAAVLGLGALGAFDPFENSVWDLRARTWAAPGPSSGLIDVVLVDQASLDWLEKNQGQPWPWPREYFAYLTDYLARSSTKATMFDVIFEQPSDLAGDDEAFAAALGRHGRVVLAEAVEDRGAGLEALPPAEPLGAAAAALGQVTAAADPDGVNRRALPTLTLADGWEVPGLALAAFALGETRPLPPLQDKAVLRYRGDQKNSFRIWPAWKLFRSEAQLREGQTPDVDPAAFRGHYVFLGYSAQGLRDLRPSPVDPNLPGVLVHATFLDNLLSGDLPRTPAWYWTSLLVVIWSLAPAWAVARLKRAVSTVPVFVAAVGLPVAAGWLAYGFGWWWPVVPPVVAALGAGLAMLLINYAVEGRDRRFIQNAFSQYLSPEVIARLVADPGQLRLGGEKRSLSIYFSDVEGFTSISEGLGPEALTALLNDYLSEMTSVIYAHGGTIDKYEGDAVIAFWNAPLDDGDHAVHAVKAALACHRRLAEIQDRLAAAAGRPLRARIGINTGPVVIGNMGSHQRFNYTFLGDAGNLASRLEGANKLFGTRLMVSEFTRQEAQGDPALAWRELGRLQVVGKSQPVTVFEPWDAEEARTQADLLGAFARALDLWYSGAFGDALAAFEALADRDEPARRYAIQTRSLLEDPPEAWDGVWKAREK